MAPRVVRVVLGPVAGGTSGVELHKFALQSAEGTSSSFQNKNALFEAETPGSRPSLLLPRLVFCHSGSGSTLNWKAQVGSHHPRSLVADQNDVQVGVHLVLPAHFPANRGPRLNAAGLDLAKFQPAGTFFSDDPSIDPLAGLQ